MKKLLSIMFVLVLSIVLIAGCTKDKEISVTKDVEPTITASLADDMESKGKLFEKPITLSIMTNSHPSYPYQEDWYIYKLIEEVTNVKLDVEAYGENLMEKLQIKLAGGKLNDITFIGAADAIRFGSDGAFVELLSNIDKLPNFYMWKSKGKDAYMTNFTAVDGKLYIFPNEGIADVDQYGYLYRKDIFEKHNINIPKDFNELYDILKKIKSIYPESYPFCNRGSLGKIGIIGYQWGTGWMIYYNEKMGKFSYGPVEDNFKALVEYFAKLYKEELIPPDFMSIDTNGWQNLISTDNGFITVDLILRIDFFNTAVQPSKPEFSLAYMKPPKSTVPDGMAKVPTTVSTHGFSVASNSKKINEALKYIDWFYTPEGSDLTCWGEEDKTYRVENEKRRFYYPNGEPMTDILALCKEYGLHTNGTYLLIDPDAEIGACWASEEMAKGYRLVEDDKLPKAPRLNFIGEELKTLQGLLDPINTHMQEEISKFILGTRNISEWDTYVKEIEDLGLAKVLDTYNLAYEKLKK